MTRAACIFLLVVTQVHGQTSIEGLVTKYDDFKRTYPGVNLTLIFNQEKFAPGDTAWFKAYFLNSDRSAVKGRQLVDLAMVGEGGKIVEHFLFAVMEGVGFNQMVLPTDLSPGIYTIAAYSRWMNNFSPPPLFTKQLIIVGENEVVEDVERSHRLIEIKPDQENIRLTFSAHEGSLLRYQQLHLVVTNGNRIIFIQDFRQGLDQRVSFSLKTTTGVMYATVIDNLGRVVTSENYKTEQQDSDELLVKIEEDDQNLTAGGQAEIHVTVVDQNGQPVQGEFAFRALNGNVISNHQPQEDPVSNALMQQKEPWLQVINDISKPLREFNTNLSRKGTAMMRDGNPVPRGTKLVFYLQFNDIILQTQSWSSGQFTLNLPDINRDDEIVAFGEYNGEDISGLVINWEETAIDLPSPPAFHETNSVDKYGFFTLTKRLIDNSYAFYSSAGEQRPSASAQMSPSALEERVGGADLTVQVQKYVTFGTMAEMIKEVIPDLASSTSRGRTSVKVSLSAPMAVASGDPLYIIDGVVSTSTPYFLGLKPASVLTVSLVTKPAKLIPLGPIGKNGIVIVETLKGDARPPAEAWQIIEGIQPAMTFRSNTSLGNPNFRSTIFWSPMEKTDAKGSAQVRFIWSDDVGPVWISVTGMTADGRCFSGWKQVSLRLAEQR